MILRNVFAAEQVLELAAQVGPCSCPVNLVPTNSGYNSIH
jgi:hypothetical protein